MSAGASAPSRAQENLAMRDPKSEPLSDSPGGGFSRRSFLKGAGLGAAGATLADYVAEAAEAARAAQSVRGPGSVALTLNVNGTARTVQVEPGATLAQVLRVDLGLTGTKIGCDRGACSACTVWLDGTPVNACLTFALDAEGRRVTTIEGLARGEELHPVQAAFIEKDAMQCGFCTPGMVMSCAALLARNPRPTLDDVQHAVSGNLCRCGTYQRIRAAIHRAAQNTPKA
jgi:aerobic-type carbon monoxide dehydrogenase small subunit (CoxS/CutS family)